MFSITTNATSKSVSSTIVEFLKTQDIQYLFGKVGEGILPILDCIPSQERLNFISTYHEQTAVMMADGFARATGNPSAVLVSEGPGCAATVGAVAQAFHDGSPVMLLSSELPTMWARREESATKGWNPESMFEKITLFSGTVTNAAYVIKTLEHAYRSCASGRKGPVYCGIPWDLLNKETPETVRHFRHFMSSGRSSGDPDSLRQACELLINAQRPVILLGGGVVWSNASTEAMELGEFLFAPLVTSSGKSGVVPDDFPLSIGRLGNEANKVASQTVAEADVVIAFGCTFNRRTTFAFSPTIFAPHVKIIQVDIDPSQIGRTYPIELGLVGDAKLVLREMVSVLRQMGAEKWPSRVIHRIQEVWERKEIGSNEWNRLARSSDVPIRRLRLLKDIAEEAGRDALIFGELLWKNCLKTAFSPLIESEDFPVAGSHLPIALGTKLALPNRQVIAILGDGQFMNALTDLATAVEHCIPVLTIVARNGCYSQAKAIQAQFYQGRYIGVDHPFPNLTDVALSLGAHGERVESPGEIRPAIRRALESQQPSLVEVVVSNSIGDLKPVFG